MGLALPIMEKDTVAHWTWNTSSCFCICLRNPSGIHDNGLYFESSDPWSHIYWELSWHAKRVSIWCSYFARARSMWVKSMLQGAWQRMDESLCGRCLLSRWLGKMSRLTAGLSPGALCCDRVLPAILSSPSCCVNSIQDPSSKIASSKLRHEIATSEDSSLKARDIPVTSSCIWDS